MCFGNEQIKSKKNAMCKNLEILLLHEAKMVTICLWKCIFT